MSTLYQVILVARNAIPLYILERIILEMLGSNMCVGHPANGSRICFNSIQLCWPKTSRLIHVQHPQREEPGCWKGAKKAKWQNEASYLAKS